MRNIYNYRTTIEYMVTTIQISEELKDSLNKYKKKSSQRYEDIIKELLIEKENDISLLKEGYEEMYGLSQEISEEFEDIDREELEKNEY